MGIESVFFFFFFFFFFDAEDTCSDSKKYSSEIPIRLLMSKGADQHMHPRV